MANRFQFKRATAANWTSADPTLAAGEPGFETDTYKLKIGDGSTAWTSLDYTTNYVTSDIESLTAATSVSGTDEVAIASGGNTYRLDVKHIMPPGAILDYVGISPPGGWLYVPLEATTISRTTYSGLWDALGNIDFFAPDSASATTAESAGNFHLPTITDAFVRGGVHGEIASVSTANNEVTIEDQRSTTLTSTHLRDGTAMRFYGDDLPAGLSNYTDYYITWDSGNSAWKIYTTEDDAVGDTGSNQVSLTDAGTGTQYATQFGINLDDAMQQITGTFDRGIGINNSSGAMTDSNIGAFGTNGTTYTGSDISFDSANSPNARTSNETRGKTSYATKIIKVN